MRRQIVSYLDETIKSLIVVKKSNNIKNINTAYKHRIFDSYGIFNMIDVEKKMMILILIYMITMEYI